MGGADITEVIADFPALPHCAAVSADDLARKAVSVLVLPAVSTDAFLGGIPCNHVIGGIKILMADDGFVIPLCEELIHFTVVPAAGKGIIGVGLLEDNISGVLLILDHAVNGMSCPSAAPLGGYAPGIQCLGNLRCTAAGKHLCEDPLHDLALLRIHHHLSICVIVTVGRIGDFVGAVAEALLNAPGLVFGNGAGFAFCQT